MRSLSYGFDLVTAYLSLNLNPLRLLIQIFNICVYI